MAMALAMTLALALAIAMDMVHDSFDLAYGDVNGSGYG